MGAWVWDFKALPRNGAREEVDWEVGASWSWDRNGTVVSYDNRDVVQRKVEYIKEMGLGGAMWWESSGDKSGEESLIATVSADEVIEQIVNGS